MISALLAVLVVVAVILLICYWKIKSLHNYWEYRGVDCVRPGILGSVQLFFRTKSFADHLVDIHRQFPGRRYHGIFVFFSPVLVVKDAELIKRITVKDFASFTDRRRVLEAENDKLWSKNLFALEGERWRQLRTTLSPAYTSSKMKLVFGLMEECASQFVDYLKSKNEGIFEVEMKDILTRYANDVIATAAFGIQVNSLIDKENEFYLMGKKATAITVMATIKFFLNTISPVLSKILRVTLVPDDITKYFTTIIQETIKLREAKCIVRPDMIHLLMEAKRAQENNNSNPKETKELTIDDIAAQAFVFFFAGFETVSTSLVFTFYELAVNPEIQDRLRDEINATWQKSDSSITYEALLEMQYLDMVVSESLRKWPPNGLINRKSVKPYMIRAEGSEGKSLLLAEGMTCWILIHAIHRDPKHYPDPEKFDPERFNEENRRKIDSSCYLPFGLGPRNCIGSRFTLLEMKLLMFFVLREFEVVPVEKTTIPVVLDTKQGTPTSKGGMWLGFKRVIN